MAFLENDTTSQERFSLLLLEPGEIYFEDYSVYYYQPGLSEQKAIQKRQRGRLKICSKSIVFDPKDIQYPILKFQLKDVSHIDAWSGHLFSRMDSKDKMIKLVSKQTVEMKEKNIIAPYIFKREEGEHLFSLNYVTVDDCLPQMCQLHRASTLPLADQTAMINAIVLSRQARVQFDTSWLEDLYEKRILETQGDRITPLVSNPGRIMVTSSRLYFQPFNNIDAVPVLKVRIRDMKRIVKRRFLLRQIGLEIFCSASATLPHLYLSLKSEPARNELYESIITQPGLSLDDAGQDNMTLLWQNRHISNCEYLVYLNSMADRSINDLTQYPVMPWIVTDYTSSELDFEDENIYRDLSKPIGALNEERLTRLKDRLSDMPEPKFLYGSHYSTPGFVLFYLARVAPEYMLCLQNGRFDQPDRMFNSLSETWINCLSGQADFKELIPEFYEGSGDFLLANKMVNFGTRQDGRPVGTIDLPPWADGPSDFIQKLCESIESNYVSDHLNEWINLTFGYKQKGTEAENADNLFYYLTYEGAVDLDSIEDLNERACMEIQIMEFGQIPKQLFSTPHPKRFPDSLPRTVSLRQENISEADPVELRRTTDTSGSILDKSISIAVLKTLKPWLRHALHKDAVTDVKISQDGAKVFSVSQDTMLKIYSVEDQRQLRSINMSNMPLSSCALMSDNHSVIVGSWDNSIYFYSIEYGRILDTVMAHDDSVSSLCWTADKLMTASWDSTVKVWQFTGPDISNSVDFMAELDHDSGVSCLSVMCNTLVSGTIDGQVCVWDLGSCYLNSQQHYHSGKVTAVVISPDMKYLMSCGEDGYFRVMDMHTGTEIFSKNADDELLCMCWCEGAVLTGTKKGEVIIWDLLNANLAHRIKVHDGPVLCLDLLQSGIVVTGGADHQVVLMRPAGSS